jgi:hypothetical protein
MRAVLVLALLAVASSALADFTGRVVSKSVTATHSPFSLTKLRSEYDSTA